MDDATFRQAIELLKVEDWEALRLLLAGEALVLQVAPDDSNTCTATNTALTAQACLEARAVPCHPRQMQSERISSDCGRKSMLKCSCMQSRPSLHSLQSCLKRYLTTSAWLLERVMQDFQQNLSLSAQLAMVISQPNAGTDHTSVQDPRAGKAQAEQGNRAASSTNETKAVSQALHTQARSCSPACQKTVSA